MYHENLLAFLLALDAMIEELVKLFQYVIRIIRLLQLQVVSTVLKHRFRPYWLRVATMSPPGARWLVKLAASRAVSQLKLPGLSALRKHGKRLYRTAREWFH